MDENAGGQVVPNDDPDDSSDIPFDFLPSTTADGVERLTDTDEAPSPNEPPTDEVNPTDNVPIEGPPATVDTDLVIDWEGLLSHKAPSDPSRTRSFSFSRINLSTDPSGTDSAASPGRRRRASLTPASLQTPTHATALLRTPVTPFSVDSADAPRLTSPSQTVGSAVQQVNQSLLDTLADLRALTTTDTQEALLLPSAAIPEAATGADIAGGGAAAPTWELPDNDARSQQLVAESTDGDVPKPTIKQITEEEGEMDLDAELARLEQEFLSELGQPIDASTSVAVNDDGDNALQSFSDSNLLDREGNHDPSDSESQVETETNEVGPASMAPICEDVSKDSAAPSVQTVSVAELPLSNTGLETVDTLLDDGTATNSAEQVKSSQQGAPDRPSLPEIAGQEESLLPMADDAPDPISSETIESTDFESNFPVNIHSYPDKTLAPPVAKDGDQADKMQHVGVHDPMHHEKRANPLQMETSLDSDSFPDRVVNKGSSVDSGIDDFLSATGGSFDTHSLRADSGHTSMGDQSAVGLAAEVQINERSALAVDSSPTIRGRGTVNPLDPKAPAVVMMGSGVSGSLIASVNMSHHLRSPKREGSASNVCDPHSSGDFPPEKANELASKKGACPPFTPGESNDSRVESLPTVTLTPNQHFSDDVDEAMHEALAFLREYETDHGTREQSRGDVSTPMSDFLSAAGSLDELVDEADVSPMATTVNLTQVHGESGLGVGSTVSQQENYIKPPEFGARVAQGGHEDHGLAALAKTQNMDHSEDPAAKASHKRIGIESDFLAQEGVLRGEELNRTMSTSDEMRKMETMLPLEEKMIESFSSIGENEIFDSEGDFPPNPFADPAAGPNSNSFALPDTSEVSLSSRAREENDSHVSSQQKLNHFVSQSVATGEQRGRLPYLTLGSDVAEALQKVSMDSNSDMKHKEGIFRSQSQQSFADGDRRRIDFSAVSSVTSASSPNTLKIFQSTGFISPFPAEEGKFKLRTGHEEAATKPPLFPRGLDGSSRHLGDSRHQTPSVNHDDSSSGFDRGSLSQFLKKTSEPALAYNAEESVFALMDDSSSSKSNAEDSGTDPEDFDVHTEDASSFIDDTGSAEISQSDTPEYHPGASVWHMLSTASPSRVPFESPHPEFVVMPLLEGRKMPESEHIDVSPSDSVASGAGSQMRRQASKSELTDRSTGRWGTLGRRSRLTGKRSTRTKLYSFRRLGFRTEQKALSKTDPSTSSSPEKDDSESSSLAGGSLATGIFGSPNGTSPLVRSFSSPDLRILEKTPAFILRELDAASPDLPLSKSLGPQRRYSEDIAACKETQASRVKIDQTNVSVNVSPLDRPEESRSPRDLLDSVHSTGAALGEEDYAHYSGDDMLNDEARLELALKEFAILPVVGIPQSNMASSKNGPAALVASARFRQLLACFSHNEVFTISCRAPTSIHLDPIIRERKIEVEESSSGVAVLKNTPFELELQGQPWCNRNSLALYGNRDGMPPHEGNSTLPSLSQFLTSSYGQTTSPTTPSILRHPVFLSQETMSINDLLREGSDYEEALVALMEHLASFAVETDFGYLPYTVSVKDAAAALAKASSKYGGDYSRVLDLLRGRIIFPDESSLVSALVELFHLGGTLVYSSGGQEKKVKFRVVRIKNLFLDSDCNGYSLPTGYRHVLLNVLFEDRFIAEIQCNLLSLFAIMGESGPDLHVEVRKMEDHLARGGYGELGDGLLVEAIGEKASPSRKALTSVLLASVKRSVACHKPSSSRADPPTIPTQNDREPGRAISSTPSNDGSLGESSEIDPEKSLPHTLKSASHDEPGQKEPKPTENELRAKVLAAESVQHELVVLDPDSSEKVSHSSASHLDADVHYESETPKAGRVLRTVKSPVNQVAPPISARSIIAGSFENAAEEINLVDTWTCFVQRALQDVQCNPRDLISLRCLILILDFILDTEKQGGCSSHLFTASGLDCVESRDDLLQFKERLLRRALAIACQDSSAGMIGWVATTLHSTTAGEVGCSQLQVLQEIGACLAQQGKWIEAEEVHHALVLRGERQLPLYHPFVVASMLDLAVSATANSKQHLAERIFGLVTDRVAAYLAEMEHLHTQHYQQSAVQTKSGLITFEVDSGRKALRMLHAFLGRLEHLANRTLMTLVPPDHDVVLAHQCIMADCSVTIANCWALSELSETEKRSTMYWEYAFGLYRGIYQEYGKDRGLDDAKICSALYGCARCLRELGKVSEALTVLTPVAKSLSHASGASARIKEETHSFLPKPMLSHGGGVDQRILAAQCQWLLAALEAENNPNEEGRKKALKCLQKASIVLRRILDSTMPKDPRHDESMRLLREIEGEARRIFHPLGRLSSHSQSQRSRATRRG